MNAFRRLPTRPPNRFLLLLLALLPLAAGHHADKYPQDYFRAPLGIPLTLAGNFAEMRSNHFHSGLDLRTNATEGYPIYAAADGWVSRIGVSPGGFGHVLYVSHPNGYTTVYAHLSRFSDPIAAHVRRLQYQQERFAVESYPGRQAFPVRKGDIIALSGNSGSSSGPHLHFEVRDAGQRPLNPLLFGFKVVDTTPPRIFRVKLYPAGDGVVAVTRRGQAPVLATSQAPALLEATLVDGTYRLAEVEQIQAWGRLGFGIQAHDYHEGARSRLGAYRIGLAANGEPLFQSEMEKFSFNQTRYLNAHVDYAEHRRHGRWIQRSHLLPGNRLSFYETTNRGFLDAAAGQAYEMTYTVEDVYGNTARLAFTVQGLDQRPATEATPPEAAAHIARTRPATFSRDGLTARFATGTFYEDLDLRYRPAQAPAAAFSPAHQLHDDATPIHKSYTLSIRPDDLPARLRAKALIAAETGDGSLRALGGRYSDGVVSARLRTFGTFFVAADTLAPVITPLNVADGRDLSQARSIRFEVQDNLSGIDAYEGRIDGQWVLFDYDAKTGRLVYTFDDRVGPGTHTLVLEVSDAKDNVRTYRAQFQR